jgi:hypothetical protein
VQRVARFIYKKNEKEEIEKKLFCSSLVYYEITINNIDDERKYPPPCPSALFSLSLLLFPLAISAMPLFNYFMYRKEEDTFGASCVAIGLSWPGFPIVGKQPGW